MFLLLLALLIGLILGQFIKIELPIEAKQELIRAIKSIPGSAKAAFDRILQEVHHQRQSSERLAGAIQPDLLNSHQPAQKER